MTPQPPRPPDELPAEVVDLLEDQGPEQLRKLARYAEHLATRRERAQQRSRDQSEQASPDDEETETPKPDDRPADPPDDVPGKATLTVKEINDNRYYYWQWREGDTVTSQYEGPVDPDE